MGYNTDASRHDEAWRYLTEELRPDVALLQEAAVPDEMRPAHSVILTSPTRSVWGSVIVGFSIDLHEVELPEGSLLHRFHSRVAVATAQIGDDQVLISSVHPSTLRVNADMLEGLDRKAVATPDGGLWEADIIYAGLRQLTTSGTKFVIGGDWMVTWLWDKIYGTESHGQFFARAATAGWVEATSRFFRASEMDLRTWYGRRGGKSTPYQLDRIFLDQETADNLSACDAIVHPAQCLGLSDHAPLVIEF